MDKTFEAKKGISETGEPIMLEQKSSFKLTKNTKGYNWDIKIVDDDLESMKKKVVEMNDWAIQTYGGKKE